jgi:hypothetical protein
VSGKRIQVDWDAHLDKEEIKALWELSPKVQSIGGFWADEAEDDDARYTLNWRRGVDTRAKGDARDYC